MGRAQIFAPAALLIIFFLLVILSDGAAGFSPAATQSKDLVGGG